MKKKLSSIKITGMIYLIPALIFVIGFNVVRFVWNIVLSFQKWNGFAAAEFVGIDNFVKVLHDKVFLKSLINCLDWNLNTSFFE